MEIEIILNDRKEKFNVKPNTLLLNLLRSDKHLTGSKYGCGIGECGACTVHIDGEAVLGCMVLAVDADGKRVDTIEGVADGDKLDPVQDA
jgi:aerobic-type carbon monoxide dehydrogenase small subunit (CoxS/CutS family)